MNNYNGWTNYDTWAVAVALDNVEDSYTRSRATRFYHPMHLKAWCAGLAEIEGSYLHDEVDFEAVNWDELLEHLTPDEEQDVPYICCSSASDEPAGPVQDISGSNEGYQQQSEHVDSGLH